MQESQGRRRTRGGDPGALPLALWTPALLLSTGVHGAALALAWLLQLRMPADVPGPVRFTGTAFELAVNMETMSEPALAESVETPTGKPAAVAAPAFSPAPEPLPASVPSAPRSIRPPPATAETLRTANGKPAPTAAINQLPAERPNNTPQLPGDGRSPAAPPPPSAPAGSYGESAPVTGAVDLYRAFLKTLPLAAKNDETWITLPEGFVGELEVQVRIDENGHLSPLEIFAVRGAEPPPVLRRAVLLNGQFLLHGRFALDPEHQREGTQRLHISAAIRSGPPDPDHAEESGVGRFGQVPLQAPTGIYFTYYSGRRVDISVSK